MILKKLKKNILRTKIGQKLKIYKNFKNKHGYSMDFKRPITFNQKIQWIKVYGELDRFTSLVDKATAPVFVRDKLGNSINIINTYGVYKSADEIKIEELPESFVIKANHGAGWVKVIDNKNTLNIVQLKKELNDWLCTNFFDLTGEENYKLIKPRIIVEEKLKGFGADLEDYKFWCFNGRVELIHVNLDDQKNKSAFYNRKWEKVDVQNKNRLDIYTAEMPGNLNEMIHIAETLSKELPFVRVDLYNTPKGIYFGELTFTPGNGYSNFNKIIVDKCLGRFINLEQYSKEMNFSYIYDLYYKDIV